MSKWTTRWSQRYMCDRCGRFFNTQVKLLAHLVNEHLGGR